ncbi:hypothetical protein ACVPOY_10790 [Staphylococcus aureus]
MNKLDRIQLKTAVEQALNNVNSAKHALNGTQKINNAKQAAITAINGASDLNQKQKDVLIKLMVLNAFLMHKMYSAMRLN